MRRLVVAMVAVLVSCGCFAAAANADIYWIYGNNIARANDDGTGVNQKFIPRQSAGDLAVDSGHIYGTEDLGGGIGEIWRANLDGSGVDENFILSRDHSDAIAVNSQHIYWSTNDDGACSGTPGIDRANLDGSNKQYGVICDLQTLAPKGLEADSHYIYWSWIDASGASHIGRANLDGSGVDENFISFAPNTYSTGGLAVDSNYIYWAEPENLQAFIGRANLDGSNPGFVFAGGPDTFTSDVAVGDQYFYWTQAGVYSGITSIWRANLDGSGATAVSASSADGFAVVWGPGGAGCTPTGRPGVYLCPPSQIKKVLMNEIVANNHVCGIPCVVRHHGYPLPFSAPTSGHAVISWYYLPRGAHLARAVRPVLVARGQRTFSRAGHATIKLKLTAEGLKLLRHAKRIRLTARGTFTQHGKRPVRASRSFVLR
jgi:hypothetical protein